MLVLKNILLINFIIKEIICICYASPYTTNINFNPTLIQWANIDNITFNFDCTQRSIGFYADIEYNCQIFHMCDQEANRLPHICANETSFNQEYRICDWDYNFNCSESEKWYYLNELTYITEMPFKDDEKMLYI